MSRREGDEAAGARTRRRREEEGHPFYNFS